MINITELAKLIREQSGLSEKYDQRYVEGLILERYELIKYDRLLEQFLKEQEEEEEEDVEDEVDVVDGDEEIEGDEDGFDDTDGDGDPDVTDPDADEDGEPDAVVDIPSDEPGSQKPTKKVKQPKNAPSIEIISKEEARELMSYKGKIFTAIFTKKDGSRRVLNGMTGVRKYTSGGELKYSPAEKGLIPVYDLKIGNGPKGYRMINVNGLEALRINGKQYKIE